MDEREKALRQKGDRARLFYLVCFLAVLLGGLFLAFVVGQSRMRGVHVPGTSVILSKSACVGGILIICVVVLADTINTAKIVVPLKELGERTKWLEQDVQDIRKHIYLENEARYRIWTSFDGKETIEARLSFFGQGVADLVTRKDKIVKLSYEKLSAEDRAFLDEWKRTVDYQREQDK